MRSHARLLLLISLILLLIVTPALAAPNFSLTVSHVGNAGASGTTDFLVGSTTGTVSVEVKNSGDDTSSSTTVTITLAGGLTYGGSFTSSGGLFTSCTGTTTVTCTAPSIPNGSDETITFPVTAPTTPDNTSFKNKAKVNSGSNVNDSKSFSIVQPLSISSLTHGGNSGDNFVQNTNTGTVTVKIFANQPIPAGSNVLNVVLGDGLTFNALKNSPAFFSTCSGAGNIVTCSSTGVAFPVGLVDTITFTVNAPSTTGSGFTNSALLTSPSDATPDVRTDSVSFSIIIAGTLTPTPTGTLTPLPTFPLPTFTVAPTLAPPTVIPTATFIPAPPTRTPPPRPANAGQAVGPIPHPDVTIVVDRDNVNVRSVPAIGATVIANVNAGYSTNILGRSGDGQWVLVKIDGQLGWIGTAVLAIVNGDINSAPVDDPRTIPYGGFENPRAGLTSVTSPLTGKLDNSGLRVRSGPGTAYVVLANAPRYTIFSLLGRTDDNLWLQVNYQGTLGWVATEFVDLQQGLGVLNQLPIDGIVADGLPVSTEGEDSYTDTLSLMLARIDLAQPSLDSIRSTWTSIALGGRVQCANFPAEPTNFNIPNPVLAPFYATLYPLDTDFNTAMTSLRSAIDLFITICGQPQPANGYVGQPVVQNALDDINQADALFSSLRQRLNALLPPQGPIDNNTQCEFTFQNRSQVVPRLLVNQVQIVHLTAHDFVLGLCFDGGAGQSLRLEALKVDGNVAPHLTVSAFGDPTNFLGTADITSDEPDVTIEPILITQTDRYIVIVANLNPVHDLDGDVALLLTDVTGGGVSASLSLDANGNVVVNQGQITPATPGAIITPGIGFTPGISTPTPTSTRTG